MEQAHALSWRAEDYLERNRRIFAEELDDFVPARVLDFHVHVLDEGTIPAGETFSNAGQPIRAYTFEDLECDLACVYPGRETAAVCFGLPHVDYDRARNDRYVSAGCDGRRWFGLRLLDPHEQDPAALRKDLAEGGFVGLKPYLDYVRKADPNDVEVHEMLPPWAMEIVDDLGLLVMLHIPRRARLADPCNQRQVAELCLRYPNARIVLAHVGRAYFYKNIVGHLDRFRELPNLYYDLAMVMHPEVLEYAFCTLPAERILYGTDIPIALAQGKSVEINDQYTYVTPTPWHLSISDDHGKLVFTSFLYEELRAIRKAVERLGLSRGFVERLFWDNGFDLLQQASRR